MAKSKTLSQLVSNTGPLSDGVINTSDVADLGTEYQPVLVSGTNIKTINSTSVLGSGNIQIDAGVTSFNTRTGAITLGSSDVTTALGYTPFSNAGGELSGFLQLNANQLRFNNSGVRSWTVGVSSGNLAFNSNDSSGAFVFGGDVSIASRFRFTSASAFTNSKYAIIGIDPTGATVGTYKNFGVYDYTNSRSMFEVDGETRNITVFGGGSFSGSVTVGYGGGNLIISATQANDIGDIVWTDYAGTEKHRLWDGGTGLNYRNNAGTGYLLLHEGNYSSYALPLAGGTMTGNLVSTSGMTAWNVTTPGTTVGNYHIGKASSTGSSGGAITFGARDASSGANAQAGIYTVSDGTYGTRMYLATTDSYANGAKTAISINETGNVSIVRGSLTQGSNQVLHAGNYSSYSPSLTGTGASGTWGINITGNSATVANLTPAQFFNNMGNNHSTYTDFNNVPGFGAYYVQQGTNSPTGTASHQWYGFTIGLGNDYALSLYGTQLYWPRAAQNADTYIYVRDREGGAWGSWRKIRSGYADSSGSSGSVSGLTLTSSSNGINPDNVTQNQIGYNTSVSLFGQSDGGLYSSAYSSSWIHQIYGDFRTGQIAIRGKNSGTWQSWRAVLDSSNYTSYSPNRSEAMIYRGDVAAANINSAVSNGVYNQLNPGDSHSLLVFDAFGSTGTVQQRFHYTGSMEFRNRTDSANWTGWKTVLTSSNYSGYALPLSGGTVTGAAYFQSNLGATSGSLSSPPLQVYCTGGNSAFMSFHRAGNYAVNMGLDSDNVLRIGGWSASANRWQLDMSGNGTYAGNVTAYSDERLKKDWAELPTDFVERLATVKSGTYTRIDSNERQAGSSAQDWQQLLPEVVSEGADEDKTLALAYGNAALVSSIELAKRVVAQEARIAQLEALLNKLIGEK